MSPECADMYLKMLPVEKNAISYDSTENKFEQQHAWSICALVEKELESAKIADFEAFIEILYIQSRGPGIAVIVHESRWNQDKIAKYFPLVGECFEACFDAKSSKSSSVGGGETKPSISAMDDFYFDTETPVWYARSDKEDNARSDKADNGERKITVLDMPLKRNHYIARGRGYEMGGDHPTNDEYRVYFAKYAKEMHKGYFGSGVAVDVMVVPVAMRHEDPELQEKLGAVFLHLGTPKGIKIEELERIYARIQSYWHFNMTSEILARRTAERDEALARERAFTLAEEPLGTITAALEATRESAQRLRALLHAPYAAFSGASSNVVGFFEEKNPVRIADRTVVVAHKAEDYAESGRDAHDAAFVLLGILAEVFGEDPAGFRGIPELVGCVGDRVYGVDPAFAELRKICVAIAGIESEPLWQYVCAAARGREEEVSKEARTAMTAALGHFKRLLHTPYKFETEGYVIAPLAAVVLSHENSVFTVKWTDHVKKAPQCKCYETLEGFLASPDATSLKMPISNAAKHRLPCPRASFLWHALTCAMDKKVKVVVDCDAASITCSNAKPPNEPCLENMRLLIEGGGGIGQVIGGDETAPWYGFAAACRPAKVEVKERGHCLIIASGGAKITIRSNVNTLTITLGQG